MPDHYSCCSVAIFVWWWTPHALQCEALKPLESFAASVTLAVIRIVIHAEIKIPPSSLSHPSRKSISIES
ncbi:MAG: hypothetical protein CBE43_09965 [Rhodopirellula sp. TMED283]|nr:MAG: hypothetical protein CBE43_09965 [Rhodopirellula sp. TMED283]